MKTQQFKSIDLRTLVNKMMNGQPINGVSTHQLYDIEVSDIDNNVGIIDEFSDNLQTMEYVLEKRENELLKQQKGGNNETQTQNEPTQNTQTQPRRSEIINEETNE